MDTGDVVLHKPSGEKWVVAFVAGRHLVNLGWPCAHTPLDQFELVTSAHPEKRMELLRQMAAMSGDDPRRTYAVRRLSRTTNPETQGEKHHGNDKEESPDGIGQVVG